MYKQKIKPVKNSEIPSENQGISTPASGRKLRINDKMFILFDSTEQSVSGLIENHEVIYKFEQLDLFIYQKHMFMYKDQEFQMYYIVIKGEILKLVKVLCEDNLWFVIEEFEDIDKFIKDSKRPRRLTKMEISILLSRSDNMLFE